MDLRDRLGGLIDRHSPGRVLVAVPDPISARWLTSLLGARGCVVGARIVDLDGLLAAAATQLHGEPVGTLTLLGWVREALLRDPEGRYAGIAEQPSYQRAVLRCFVELERGLAGVALAEDGLGPLADDDERDRAMLAAFARFRGAVADHCEAVKGGWWAGQTPSLVEAGADEVSFLRRRAAAVAVGFTDATLAGWQRRILAALGFERWGAAGPSGLGRRELDLRLSCAGPEAEIAAVARLLRERPESPSVVLAPAQAIPRWAARLRHRDVPVRAWVEHRARETGTARVVMALLAVLAAPNQARRQDIEAVLFSPALGVWKDRSDALGSSYPRDPSPSELREVWDQQRSASVGLAALAERVRAAEGQALAALDARAERFAWAPSQWQVRRERTSRAHALVAAAVDQLAGLAAEWRPSGLRALLDGWDLLARAARHGADSPTLGAARVITETIAVAAPTASVASLTGDLDHALARARLGRWVEQRSIAGGPPVWLLPYASASVLGSLPERVLLTGLDGHPAPPTHHGPVSERLRGRLGLIADADRFRAELRELDERVASVAADQPVVASWRHRDGGGARRPPGPWLAGRQDEGEGWQVGVDAIALPPAERERGTAGSSLGGVRPRAPRERALLDWRDDPLLRRRVEAICSHDLAELGPHTGELGIAVPAELPYSASALQSYAALPFRYFVERVLGLRERERPATSASALLATEQGQVVHHALEAALAARAAATPGPLALAGVADELLDELLAGLARGYRERAEHGHNQAIWASERDRWAAEIQVWWQRWRERMVEGWQAALGQPSAAASPATSGVRRRREPDVLIPAPFLLAVEWSPAAADERFELDLGRRTIPFVAAIDRIEIDPARQRLNVCDYKSGRPRWPALVLAELRAGLHLQLPLYALVVHQVIARAPERLGLHGSVPVGALRLEYLQRPRPQPGGRTVTPQARGFAPDAALGVDLAGRVWTIADAAAGFTLAFVAAIEAGRFPVVARTAGRRTGAAWGRVDRVHELARVVPSADQRDSGLPSPLLPLTDPQQEREVVR